MEIGLEYRPDKAVGCDDLREPLTHINIKNGYATATDGHIAAFCPIKMNEDGTDTEGMISVDALMIARKTAKKNKMDVATISIDGEQRLMNGTIVPRPDGAYPNAQTLVDGALTRDAIIEIGFNPTNLKHLADAIGAGHGVKLRITGETGTIVVRPIDIDNTAYGLLIPIRITE